MLVFITEITANHHLYGVHDDLTLEIGAEMFCQQGTPITCFLIPRLIDSGRIIPHR